VAKKKCQPQIFKRTDTDILQIFRKERLRCVNLKLYSHVDVGRETLPTSKIKKLVGRETLQLGDAVSASPQICKNWKLCIIKRFFKRQFLKRN